MTKTNTIVKPLSIGDLRMKTIIDAVVTPQEILQFNGFNDGHDVARLLAGKGFSVYGSPPKLRGIVETWEDPKTMNFHYRQVIEI